MSRFSALLVAVVICSAGTAAFAQQTYRNPIIDNIDAADPTVIRYEGMYYLYPTHGGNVYDVFVSEDLVRWKRRPSCFTDGRGGLWAPDVFHHVRGDGKFYLYYTVNRPRGGKLIGVAVADHPRGPFDDKGTLVEIAIDAHLFQDGDGALYLYYVDMRQGFKIVVQSMADPLTLKGERTVLIQPTDPWETAMGQVTEGPWMLKHQGMYYLMYSGSAACGTDYAIGYATATSPTGPFSKHPGNPIAKQGNGVFGPGHLSVTTGPHGALWMVYHQKDTTKIDYHRFLAIDPLWFDDDGVIHVKTTRGTDEPAPSAGGHARVAD